MREIKFRGLNTRGEWVYGSLVQTTSFCVQHSKTWIVERAFGNGGWFNVQCRQYVRPATVGQFTGLRDKSGVEIYEDDILRCSKYIGGNFVERCYEHGYVEFVFGSFGLHRKQGFYRPFKDWFDDWELEVIGNIHENPELLEQQPCE